MNLAYMTVQERNNYLKKQSEMYDTFKYYCSRVQSWMAKKVESTIVMEDAGVTSHYLYSAKEVHIEEGSEKRVYGHEYGHEFYHRFIHDSLEWKLDTSEMFEWFYELFDEEEDFVREIFNTLGDRKTIRILTDFLACHDDFGPNVRKMGFIGHRKGYGGTHAFDIAVNEAFAEFFAVLYIKDWLCYKFMVSNFPKFVDSCFMYIDKGITATA